MGSIEISPVEQVLAALWLYLDSPESDAARHDETTVGARILAYSHACAVVSALARDMGLSPSCAFTLKRELVAGYFALPSHVTDDAIDSAERYLSTPAGTRVRDRARLSFSSWLRRYQPAPSGTALDCPTDVEALSVHS